MREGSGRPYCCHRKGNRSCRGLLCDANYVLHQPSCYLALEATMPHRHLARLNASLDTVFRDWRASMVDVLNGA